MNFNETITSRGYTIQSSEEERITIQKTSKLDTIFVIFNKKHKYIRGVLRVDSLIENIKELQTIKEHFDTLQEDMDIFQKLSKYSRID